MGQCFSNQNKIASTPVDVNHFKVERVVGVGGFGKVNCVTKLYGSDADQHYAMKTLWKKEAFKSKSSEEMLFNERAILEKLRHPRLVNMLYAFQDPYRCYLVLDLALGGDLAYQQRQQPSGTFDETTTMFYIGQLFQALEYMHSLNILHRDIKPDNLVLEANGYIKLTDFGISKYMNEKRRCNARSGTGVYMAPEIKDKKSHGIAADIYAMGITMYVFLTGYLPIPKDKNKSKKKKKQEKARRNSTSLLMLGNIHQKNQKNVKGNDNKNEFKINDNEENRIVNMDVESKETMDKHDIILNGINDLKATNRYTPACLDFLKSITLDDEYSRLQLLNSSATGTDTGTTGARVSRGATSLLKDVLSHQILSDAIGDDGERTNITIEDQIYNENIDIGIHSQIRKHEWWQKINNDANNAYLKQLEIIEMEPPFIPNTSKANCDTGHTDATDTLLGEGFLEMPNISSRQEKRLELYNFNTDVVVSKGHEVG